MSIRPALQKDAPLAARLLYDALHDIAHQLTGADEKDEALTTLEAFFRAENGRLSYKQALVKELDGKPAGIVVSYAGADAEMLDEPIVSRLRQIKHDPSIRLDPETELDEYYIDTLSVSPAYGGRGIGTALVIEVQQLASQKGHRKLALVVSESNDGAYALYRKLGFTTDKWIRINGGTYQHMVKYL